MSVLLLSVLQEDPVNATANGVTLTATTSIIAGTATGFGFTYQPVNATLLDPTTASSGITLHVASDPYGGTDVYEAAVTVGSPTAVQGLVGATGGFALLHLWVQKAPTSPAAYVRVNGKPNFFTDSVVGYKLPLTRELTYFQLPYQDSGFGSPTIYVGALEEDLATVDPDCVGNIRFFGVSGTLIEQLCVREQGARYTLTATASLIDGVASGAGANGTANGQTLTATASLVSGTATGGATTAAQTLTDTATLVLGAATGTATAAGQTLSATASLSAGAASGGANVAGQLLANGSTLITGTASGGATASGQTISSTDVIIAGTATGDASIAGTTITAIASLIDGVASGTTATTQDGAAAGVLLAVTTSLLAGTASGTSPTAAAPVSGGSGDGAHRVTQAKPQQRPVEVDSLDDELFYFAAALISSGVLECL